MKFKKLIVTAALLVPLVAFAQDAAPNVVVGPVSREQKMADKKKEKQKAHDDKVEQKGIKKQIKIQDKQTRKRMKQSRKEADRVNANKPKKTFFLKRWFSKKRH